MPETESFFVLILPIFSCLCTSVVTLDGFRSAKFEKCSKGLISVNGKGPFEGRSALDCLQMCARLSKCSGTNVCPKGLTDQVTCRLSEEDLTSEACGGLTTPGSPSCFHMQKLDEETTRAEETTRTTLKETTPTIQEETTLTPKEETTRTIQEETTRTTQEETTRTTQEETTPTTQETTQTEETTRTTLKVPKTQEETTLTTQEETTLTTQEETTLTTQEETTLTTQEETTLTTQEETTLTTQEETTLTTQEETTLTTQEETTLTTQEETTLTTQEETTLTTQEETTLTTQEETILTTQEETTLTTQEETTLTTQEETTLTTQEETTLTAQEETTLTAQEETTLTAQEETTLTTQEETTTRTTQEETTPTTQEQTTTEIKCENGGTPNGTNCLCPTKFGGRTCNRMIRDCSEPYLNGHRSESQNGIYQILPAKAPAPFWVVCVFNYGGVTYPLKRRADSQFNQNWNMMKYGFGDNLESNPNSENFFIGMENLYYLLEQAEMEINMYMNYDSGPNDHGGAFYENFKIGNESTSYEMGYRAFENRSQLDNGFSTTNPLKFSASDHEVNGCYSLRNQAGWYDQNCYKQYTVFSNPNNLFWPINEVSRSIIKIGFNVVRLSPYYDE